jgi:hypothetical protein
MNLRSLSALAFGLALVAVGSLAQPPQAPAQLRFTSVENGGGGTPGGGGGGEPAPDCTLWVDGSIGNDATTKASNTALSPWDTIGRAAWGSTNRASPNSGEAAAADDVVCIAAGTYSTVGQGNRWEVAYNPANEGTSGHPIRFQTTGTVNLTLTGDCGPVIGANNKNYIEWSGFTISYDTACSESDTGPVVFTAPDFDYVQGGSIENSRLIGDPNYADGDNYNAIRLEYANGQRIYNNWISGFGTNTPDHNHSCMTTYKWEAVTFENNLCEDSGAGIYLKATQTTTREVGLNTIRYNIFRDNGDGILVHRAPNTEAEPILIYQNLFIANTVHGVKILRFDGGNTDPMWARVVNNTFYQNEVAMAVGSSGVGLVDNAGIAFWNNISYDDDLTFLIETTSAATTLEEDRFSSEHNVSFSPNTAFANVAAANVTMANWKSTWSKDSVSPAAISTDPLLVNPGTDFKLQGGSPALTQGVVIHSIGGTNGATIPAGAYITGTETIGQE